MTNDEVIDWIKTAQQHYTPEEAPHINKALDIALWRLEREPAVFGHHGYCNDPRCTINKFESEHPRPGS